jgi:glycosyltransferase involved in cell wall biosynthesis
VKILLLTTSYPLRKGSRSGVFIQKMVERLPVEIKVTVLTPDDSSTEACISSDCCAIVPFRYAPKGWQRLAHGSGGITAALAQSKQHLFLLPPLLCSCFIMTCRHARKADVLHANWSVNGVIAGIVGLLVRKPVVTTLRGSDVSLAGKSWLMRQMASACLRLSRTVVTVSPALKHELRRQIQCDVDKIRVIVNGIDPVFFAAGANRQVAEDSTVRFLYAGNLVSGKGVQVILAAAARLRGDWYLDIAGDGPEREKLEAFCQQHSLQNKVRFHGSVAPELMPELMRQAEVFVFASFAEGRPNAVLEAMAAGLPVLASAIPALQELLEHQRQGLLFPPGDAEQLAEYMEYCLNHPTERGLMGRNSRRHIESLGLSWQETASRYAALYKEVSQP